jgi:hypothetical protein
MSIDYSVNALLTSVKQRSMNADNQNLLQNADIVRIASEELQAVLIPYIESVKGEYWVVYEDIPFVQGQIMYTIPQRATGTKWRDVCLMDMQNNRVLLNYINPEDMKSSWAYSPYQFGFYPEADHINLFLGNLVGSGNYKSVRMYYFRRPNTLCTTLQSDSATANAGQVVSFNAVTQTITLDYAPPAWTTSTQFDIVNSLPPFDSRVDNATITNISGFVLTFANPLPSDLSVGDWVSEANFSPIPQIPVECQRLLEVLTAARILQYTGDPAFQVMQAMAESMKKDLFQVLSPRIDGSPRKIPIRNRLWGWVLLFAVMPWSLFFR